MDKWDHLFLAAGVLIVFLVIIWLTGGATLW